MRPSNPHPRHLTKRIKTYAHKRLYRKAYRGAGKKKICISTGEWINKSWNIHTVTNFSQIKEAEYWQHLIKQNLTFIMPNERHKNVRLHTSRFCLYDILEKAKYRDRYQDSDYQDSVWDGLTTEEHGETFGIVGIFYFFIVTVSKPTESNS